MFTVAAEALVAGSAFAAGCACAAAQHYKLYVPLLLPQTGFETIIAQGISLAVSIVELLTIMVAVSVGFVLIKSERAELRPFRIMPIAVLLMDIPFAVLNLFI